MPRKIPCAFIALLAATSAVPSRAGECLTWEQQRTTPERRTSFAMAYDSHRGVTVLYGGYKHYARIVFQDTWEWDGKQWALRNTKGPGPRSQHAMCFDSRRSVTVLFGGGENDTWEWDGADWVLRDSNGPSALAGARLAYDSRRGLSILVGQVYDGLSYPYPFQTWAWDGEYWAMLSEESLAAWDLHSLAFDERRGVLVLLGAFGDANLVWEWDGASWDLRDSVGIRAFGNFDLAYDTRRGRTVAYGGTRWEPFNTWEWDGSSWTAYADPELGGSDYHARSQALAYDSKRGVTVLFGGRPRPATNTAKVFHASDTWEWDGTHWMQRQAGLWGMLDHAMAFDREAGAPLMYFGSIWPSHFGDLWEWGGQGWTKVAGGGPGFLETPSMAFDESRRVTVLFGSYSDENYQLVSETWELDSTAWVQQSSAMPPGRYQGALTYDPDQGRTLLFGGWVNYGEYLDDLWAWDGSQWRLVGTGGPSPRGGHAMAYDRRRGRLVLFGGERSDWSSWLSLGDTWEFDGRQWSLRSTSGPSPRYNHAMAFDEARGVTVLYGGVDEETWGLADVWEWDGASWSERPHTGPTGREGHVLIYDPIHRGVLLHGGSWDEDARAIWELGYHELLPDCDQDCDVDLSDFAVFQSCMGEGRGARECVPFDADSSGDVSVADFRAVQEKLSGPAGP